MNITILLSSVRDNRLADSVYQKVNDIIGDRFKHTLVDPLKYDLPLLNKRFYEMTDPEQKFVDLHNIFEATDGFIIVTAEYNHSIPPALSNMLDHFGKEFRYKACGLASYSDGAIGGARCIEQLRLMCSTLGMPPIPASPSWSFAQKANLPEGKDAMEAFEKGFTYFLDQFIWYTEALMDKRKKGE